MLHTLSADSVAMSARGTALSMLRPRAKSNEKLALSTRIEAPPRPPVSHSALLLDRLLYQSPGIETAGARHERVPSGGTPASRLGWCWKEARARVRGGTRRCGEGAGSNGSSRGERTKDGFRRRQGISVWRLEEHERATQHEIQHYGFGRRFTSSQTVCVRLWHPIHILLDGDQVRWTRSLQPVWCTVVLVGLMPYSMCASRLIVQAFRKA